ncbi:MAG: DUF2917 domain-containing protein [Sulfuritalea sp.]|nr:DUF2917 domain-containing protein [Sulfuritalea sp.]
MSTQALSTSSIACLARHNRRFLMQVWNRQAASPHATQFLKGMYETRAAHADQSLLKDQFVELPDRPMILECVSGHLWLTRAGDSSDYFLEAGERIKVVPGEAVVVQALGPSLVRWRAAG